MHTTFFFPVMLFALSVFTWNVFPRRIAQDVAEWELTQQQGRRYVFLYRSWCVAFTLAGLALVWMTLTGK